MVLTTQSLLTMSVSNRPSRIREVTMGWALRLLSPRRGRFKPSLNQLSGFHQPLLCLWDCNGNVESPRTQESSESQTIFLSPIYSSHPERLEGRFTGWVLESVTKSFLRRSGFLFIQGVLDLWSCSHVEFDLGMQFPPVVSQIRFLFPKTKNFVLVQIEDFSRMWIYFSRRINYAVPKIFAGQTIPSTPLTLMPFLVTVLSWSLVVKFSHLVPALMVFHFLIQFRKPSSMAAFPNVFPDIRRLATWEFFRDSNAAFNNEFFKALVKGVPSRHTEGTYETSEWTHRSY